MEVGLAVGSLDHELLRSGPSRSFHRAGVRLGKFVPDSAVDADCAASRWQVGALHGIHEPGELGRALRLVKPRLAPKLLDAAAREWYARNVQRVAPVLD